MADFEEMYFKLFAATADAVQALEHQQPEQARWILIEAQRRMEEMSLSAEKA